jgi:hypothetical protein
MQALGTTGARRDVPALALQLPSARRNGGLADRDGFAARAASAYAALCSHPDVRSLYARRHPPRGAVRGLPRRAGTVVRGTIDCLVPQGPRTVTVLEFKTGPAATGTRRAGGAVRLVASQLFPAPRSPEADLYES